MNPAALSLCVALRFDDDQRTLSLSVGDLIALERVSGDLSLEVVQATATRLAQGREVHQVHQAQQSLLDRDYRAEVTVRHQLAVGGWTVKLMGRLDGLTQEGQRVVVEEIKSTAIEARRLYRTELADWPAYVDQVRVYLWMVHAERRDEPMGRLVLVSLADGSRHVLGVPLDEAGTDAFVRVRLEAVVRDRELRIAWLTKRRGLRVEPPFEAWRPGQGALTEAVREALDAGQPLLADAPTGLGKTAAVMHGALAHGFQTDRQLFWATARTTQQAVVEQTVRRWIEAGLPLRAVTITAKDKACLNDVVACRPESCGYAEGYYDKLREHGVVEQVLARGCASPEDLAELGQTHKVCPYQLASDATARADVVIGDYNYAFDTDGGRSRLFGEEQRRWVVVADEVHQLVERARGYASPRIDGALARRAGAMLAGDTRYSAFDELAHDIADEVGQASLSAVGPMREGVVQVEPSVRPWSDLSARVDELGLDYALLKAEHPLPEGADDPWIDTARATLRFAKGLEARGDETVCLAEARSGREAIRLLCLDPSPFIGPRIASFGGFIGCSATLEPVSFLRDLLGLAPDLRRCSVPSPFSPDNRLVVVAPRLSTTFKDRPAHAEATAKLIEGCVAATPGNVAVYFPSFAFLEDITARLELPDRALLVQERSMDEPSRRAWLKRLGGGDERIVLAAVLGGIFAEGIDLPAGALHTVVIAGPALPPVGLERDLLRACYDERYGGGFLYASLVPGMTKVVQAAGRLIRRLDDRGVVVLVGKRFRWRDYRALLPSDWQVQTPHDPVRAVAAFWEQP